MRHRGKPYGAFEQYVRRWKRWLLSGGVTVRGAFTGPREGPRACWNSRRVRLRGLWLFPPCFYQSGRRRKRRARPVPNNPSPISETVPGSGTVDATTTKSPVLNNVWLPPAGKTYN